MNLAQLQSILVSGLVLGSLYALLGTGLSLVWGSLRMFNFAHGTLMMFGAYAAWTVASESGLGYGLAAGIALGVAAVVGLGIVLERVLIRPFLARRDAILVAIITTLAGSIFLENSAILIWGPRMKQLPRLLEGEFSVFGMAIGRQDIIIMVVAPALLVLLGMFLKGLKLGLAIRAVEQNQDSALLLGVRVPAIYTITFGVAAGFAALAGILLGSIRLITPSMATEPFLKAFIVVIFGGLGSMKGTIAGAYAVGLIEALSMFFIGLYWTPAVLFFVMMLVLVFKPTGLFGEE